MADKHPRYEPSAGTPASQDETVTAAAARLRAFFGVAALVETFADRMAQDSAKMAGPDGLRMQHRRRLKRIVDRPTSF